MRILTEEDVWAAVRGGSVFACGGGGWVDHGLQIGHAAVSIGQPKLVSVDELPDDAIVITATAIGAPAGTNWQMLGTDYIKAVKLLQENYEGKVIGVMTPQNGMSSTINGWLPAALLDLVVVDATGDIRAHPTGKMGSMGLAALQDYETIQVVVGGKRETGSYLELVVKGSPSKTSNILRTAADQAGGFIASARHPLPASYIKKHAAIGGISITLDLGKAIIAAQPKGADHVIDTIVGKTKGTILGKGIVVKRDVHYSGAFDIGTIEVEVPGDTLILHVMNEYMAVDGKDGKRLTTYPDVITTLSAETGLPVSVGHVEVGAELVVLSINKQYVPLSSSVKDPTVYPEVEKALGISLAEYALDGILV
ncbi:DUF917 domain-containing protein [Paenibacillus sp. Root444D2]|uniref:DUF917 domain-containing protein n=1 Tax=Paenibacillus sp. Root444D2 TaxID=1736538 RepID=UPI000709D03A|nr:DUF917 family protein [Paenibacillus sp. Root444D2]KQX48924.1 hypothetical protein ASD40_12290 [Paenibacillus sp. Root444D2]